MTIAGSACACVTPQLQRCKADLDSSLPPPLDSAVVWLQRAEAALTTAGEEERDHAGAAKEARVQQDTLKVIFMFEQMGLSLFPKVFTDNSEMTYGTNYGVRMGMTYTVYRVNMRDINILRHKHFVIIKVYGFIIVFAVFSDFN